MVVIVMTQASFEKMVSCLTYIGHNSLHHTRDGEERMYSLPIPVARNNNVVQYNNNGNNGLINNHIPPTETAAMMFTRIFIAILTFGTAVIGLWRDSLNKK